MTAEERVETEEVMEMLPVALTEDGFRQRGRELTKLDEEIRDIREELKELKRLAAEKIGALRERGHRLIGEMKSASAPAEVTVAIRRDWAAGVVTRVRRDTGEELERRAMTAVERQMEMGTWPDLPRQADLPRREEG